MENQSLFFLLAVVSFTIWCSFYIGGRRRKSSKLPPGPYPLPIVGNIFQLTGMIYHAALAKLSQTYGPLMSIRQGNQLAIIVSSPKVAKELLHKHDQTFSKRVDLDAAGALDHNKIALGWIPATNQWRNLRKLCKEQLFSSARLSASEGLRQEKVKHLCNYVQECSIKGQAVDIGAAAYTTSLNFLSNTLFSVDFGDYDSSSSKKVKEIISGALETIATPNLADFIPVLKVLDPQGLRHKTKFYFEQMFEILEGIISQRLEERGKSVNSSGKNDMLEVLLDLNQQHETGWSFKEIKHMLLDLFLGGMDTTSATVEWAMAELLRNPEKMEKVRIEIREVIGQNKFVQESDISILPYLQAVVKETFRLHPAATLLTRKPDTDIEIDQYIVPKNAQIMVNVWAIGRDSSVWINVDSFVPERFLDSEIDFKGQDFELLPFGTGRRICLGLPLAYRMVHLMLASFLHNYDWKLEEGMKSEDIDMTEKFGISVQKAVPLKAIPIRTTM